MRAKPNAGRPTTPCWLWSRAKDGAGYGAVWHQGRVVGAHRYVYETLIGPIPDGVHMDHLCRTPACVNPDHLEPVRHRENIRRGNAAALSFDLAEEIRNERGQGVAISLLALKYGVGHQAIKDVLAFKTWKRD